MLTEPLGNWFRIGTKGARIATIDMITYTRGALDDCVLQYELSRVRHCRAVHMLPWGFILPLKFEKKLPTDVSDHAHKTSVFVSGRCYAEGCFGIPRSPGSPSLDPSSKEWTDTSGLARALRWGSAASPWRLPRSSPSVFQIQTVEIEWVLLSGSHHAKTLTRHATKHNDAGSQRFLCRRGPSFGNGSGPYAIPVSCQTGVLSCRRVERPSRRRRTFLCLQYCYERRRRSEVIVWKVNG